MRSGTWRTPLVILVCGTLALLISFGVRQVTGLFIAPVSADLGWDRDVFSLAIAVQALLWGVFTPLAGAVADKFGSAKAVAFGEALTPEFVEYSKAVAENARVLAATLKERGFDIVSGGTDTHLMLVDLRPKEVKGNAAEVSLEHAGMTCNKNGIPFDPEKPMVTSGIRLGTPAATTRGFGPEEFRKVGNMISDVLEALAMSNGDNSAAEKAAREEVRALCARFPIYPDA